MASELTFFIFIKTRTFHNKFFVMRKVHVYIDQLELNMKFCSFVYLGANFALTYEFLYGILTRFIIIGHRKFLPSAMVMEVVGFIRQYVMTSTL